MTALVAPGPAPTRALAGRSFRAAGAWALATIFAVAGCAPSLATLQPAHVAPRGHVQATLGMEVAIPTGTVDRVVDAGRSLADDARTRTLSDPEIARLFDSGVALVSSPPSVSQHLGIAYTVIDRTEVSLRYAGGGWRFGGRYQVLRHDEHACDLVIGLGVAHATTSIPLGDVVPYLEARDFSRWTFDLPITVGTSRDWFRVWGGPKFLYSRFDTAVTINLPMNPLVAGSLDGHARYIGGQGGVALGYRHLFLGIELTMGEISGSATVTTMLSVPTPSTDISGFVVYPAFALMGEF